MFPLYSQKFFKNEDVRVAKAVTSFSRKLRVLHLPRLCRPTFHKYNFWRTLSLVITHWFLLTAIFLFWPTQIVFNDLFLLIRLTAERWLWRVTGMHVWTPLIPKCCVSNAQILYNRSLTCIGSRIWDSEIVLHTDCSSYREKSFVIVFRTGYVKALVKIDFL